MQTYVIADTHWGHKKLIDVGARPEDFEDRIIKNWRRLVQPEDLVFHLGDVWLSNRRAKDQILWGLPGKKILTLGNHDGESVPFYMQRGFDFVCESFSIKRFGLQILFSHEPVIGSHFDLNIHGHVHSGEHRECEPQPNQILLSLEEDGYEPKSLQSLVKRWQKDRA